MDCGTWSRLVRWQSAWSCLLLFLRCSGLGLSSCSPKYQMNHTVTWKTSLVHLVLHRSSYMVSYVFFCVLILVVIHNITHASADLSLLSHHTPTLPDIPVILTDLFTRVESYHSSWTSNLSVWGWSWKSIFFSTLPACQSRPCVLWESSGTVEDSWTSLTKTITSCKWSHVHSFRIYAKQSKSYSKNISLTVGLTLVVPP